MTDLNLPNGIRSRRIENLNGLTMHVLEAGHDQGSRPCLLLLHGAPELAYSWRKIMLPLVEAGYHVVAPDQRGYGQTTGWNSQYDGDLSAFAMPNLVTDAIALLRALGREKVAGVIGHDFGSPVAAWCAVSRPDIFSSVVLMSAPFGGTPVRAAAATPGRSGLDAELAKLDPPRRHYQHYYGLPEAADNMRHCPQGVHDFLRAYYHMKSADWAGNTPHPLKERTATALAELPTYYVMPRDMGMAETVALEMPSAAEISAATWLTDAELQVYSEAFAETGFQGSLQWYRALGSSRAAQWFQTFAGQAINVPACFIAGASDWGVYQAPGVFERMQSTACSNMVGCHLVEGAGHWVQQEQPEQVVRIVLEFLAGTPGRSRTGTP